MYLRPIDVIRMFSALWPGFYLFDMFPIPILIFSVVKEDQFYNIFVFNPTKHKILIVRGILFNCLKIPYKGF